MNNYRHPRELRLSNDLDPLNFKSKISFDEKVAVVKYNDEYSDSIVLTTVNELLKSLESADYSLTHSKVYNRIFAYTEKNGQGHSATFDYYKIN